VKVDVPARMAYLSVTLDMGIGFYAEMVYTTRVSPIDISRDIYGD